MRREGKTEEKITTGNIWPKVENSCGRCWNEELRNGERAHEIVIAQPVWLIEKDGTRTQVGYVSRCPRCGWIKHYGNRFIYKLNGRYTDFNMRYWPELIRNMVLPDEFEEAIMAVPGDNLPIVDARNGLKQPVLTDKEKFIWKRWERLAQKYNYD